MLDGINAVIAVTAVVAAIAIVAAIFVVGGGRGGELSSEHADYPPLGAPGRPFGGTDAALLRLPMGLWGYHQQVTDEAMWRFAQALTERDTRIAVLEQQLAEARGKPNARRAVTAPERPALPAAGSEWARPDERATRPSGGQVFKPAEDDRA